MILMNRRFMNGGMRMIFNIGKIYPLKNGDIFYHREKQQKLYKIPKADIHKFNAFRNAVIISLAISAIIYSIFPNQLFLTLLLGICSYGLITSTFYSRILPKYITTNKKDKKQLEQMLTEVTPPPIWKSIVIILVGMIVIISSFYIQTERIQQLILIIFGTLLTISGSYAAMKK